ncbi:MAG: non-homologous end-joining DNA ligase [Candidatus Babeliales bacterium]
MKVTVNNRSIELTHLDKVWFPRSGIIKEQVVSYYHAIAPMMMPYITGHPVAMLRCPNGITDCFYQKDAPDYFPDWIKRFATKTQEGKSVHYVVMSNAASLVYLANQGVLTPHIWSTKYDKPHYPDQMIFDLDPESANDFKQVCFIALQMRAVLQKYTLPVYLKLTGSRGVHVVIPIKRTVHIDDVRALANVLAMELIEKFPDDATLEMRNEERKGRIFIDTIRNSYTHTTVPVYGVRDHEYAPIAAPIEWKELNPAKINSHTFTIATIARRLKRVGDVWQGMQKKAVTLQPLLKSIKQG